MKKFLFTIAALVFGVFHMNAQKIWVENVEIPEKGQATLTVKYETGGKTIVYYGFKMVLPKGLSYVMDENNEENPAVDYVDGKGFNLTYSEGNFGFLPAGKNSKIQGTEGTLFTLTLKADETLKQNDSFVINVENALFAESTAEGNKEVELDPSTFTVTIVENRIELDEEVGVTSETPTGEQNVLVKRAIKAGNWSTICLPFAMDANQMKTAFGEGVELADFTSYDPVYDADDNVTSIEVNFTTTSEFEANHPYIVKVGADITEIKLDGVMLEPSEEDAYIEYDNGKTGRQRVVYGTFVGTYTAETLVPADDLFLSGNKFYYSTGSTKMKAFRGFFELTDVLAVKASGAKINISVDGEATSIDGIGTQHVVEGVYDLSGRKIQLENGDLNKLQKGVYIIDGKKVTIK